MVERLEPSADKIFYILDSHRPYDLTNVYSENQVQILGELDNDEYLPEYNDVFREEVCYLKTNIQFS